MILMASSNLYATADPSDKQIHQRVGHGNQIVLTAGMNPRVDHVIDRAVDEPLDDAHVQIFPNRPLFLSQFHNLGYDIPVHLGHLFDLFMTESAVLMGLGLINDGHVAVFLELLKMDADQAPQLFFRCFRLIHRIPESFKNLAGLILVKLDQNVVLVLEIEIDGPVRHTGLFGNLGNCRLKKPLLGEYGDGRVEDTPVLVPVFLFRADGAPPDNDGL
jgi:hypothetical protein